MNAVFELYENDLTLTAAMLADVTPSSCVTGEQSSHAGPGMTQLCVQCIHTWPGLAAAAAALTVTGHNTA